MNGKIHTMDGSNWIVCSHRSAMAALDNVGDGIGGGGGNRGDQPQGEDGHPWVDRFNIRRLFLLATGQGITCCLRICSRSRT